MTISHVRHGDGPAHVIFLHDWSVSADGNYDGILPYLDAEKLTMVFADLRGYGRSIDMKGEYSAEEASRDVLDLADSLGWEKFSVVGHSMTGMVVQRIMVDMPERLVSIVATAPIPASGFPLDEETFAFFQSMTTDDDAFRQGMHALTSERYGDGWVNFKLAQNRESVSAHAMKVYSEMWSKSDFSDDASGNKTPILVVYGEHDNEGLRQDATGPLFRKWYPNLEEHVCPCGHYPMLESPVEYANAVEEYLVRKHS